MRLDNLASKSLFILFVLYYAQNWLYDAGSLISQACILIIIMISGIYLVKTLLLKEKKDLFFIAWTLFVSLNLIGFLFNPDLSEGPVRNTIKNSLGCLLPFYPFYYFSRKDEIKAKHLIVFFLMILPIIIIRYFTKQASILSESVSDTTGVVNNYSYMFVSVLPYVFLLYKKKLASLILTLILVMFIIQGAKRGAIIAGVIGLLMYFYFQLRIIEKNHRILGYIGAMIAIVILGVFVYITSSSNEFMLNRMSSILEGETSNRTYIYSTILENWYNSDNFLNFLFGYGVAGSISLSGQIGGYAHNDWLELLSNFGIIGFFAYLFLFYSAYKTIKTKGWATEKKLLMLTMVGMWFFVTLVSMWYTALEYFSNAILFGYLLGDKNPKLE